MYCVFMFMNKNLYNQCRRLDLIAHTFSDFTDGLFWWAFYITLLNTIYKMITLIYLKRNENFVLLIRLLPLSIFIR